MITIKRLQNIKLTSRKKQHSFHYSLIKTADQYKNNKIIELRMQIAF